MSIRAFFASSTVLAAFLATTSPSFSAVADLTAAEKQWISDNPVIRLAPDPGHMPIEYVDAKGRLRGISAGFLDVLEKKTGLRFEIVRPKNWADAMRMVRDREADAMSAAIATEDRMKFMSFAAAHLTLPGVIMVRDNGVSYPNLASLKGKTLGVVSGYIWEDWIRRDYPSIKLKPVSSMQAGLLLTSFGELDAMMGNLATATHTVRRLGITNLSVSGETEYTALLSFAGRNDWPMLNTILQKGLSAITPAEHRLILSKYITLSVKEGLNRRAILLILMATLGVVMMAAAAAWLWNKSLRQMVHQ